jgi:tRNA A37 N6-isopentenylltransferase MiaA
MHSPYLATALEAARAAADVVRRYYRSNLAVTIKADKSPVTEADVETEKTIRGIIATRQLAKRQITWLRSMPKRLVVAADGPQDPIARVVELAKDCLQP